MSLVSWAAQSRHCGRGSRERLPECSDLVHPGDGESDVSSGPVQNAEYPALASSLVESFVVGGKSRPVLPEGRRGEVIAALTRLMLDTAALDAYVAALEAERRRRGVDLLLLELPCADLPDGRIAKEGLPALSDEELADLA